MQSKESGLRSALFFVCRIRPKIQYHSLFANAWRNKLMLAEAARPMPGIAGMCLALSPNRRNGLDSHDRSWTWGAITVPVGKM
jgi:hypothetical protein